MENVVDLTNYGKEENKILINKDTFLCEKDSDSDFNVYLYFMVN